MLRYVSSYLDGLSPTEMLPSKDVIEQQNSSSPLLTAATTSSLSKRQHLDESNTLIYNYINVLLLGESGVGKSTFINALVNYHKIQKF